MSAMSAVSRERIGKIARIVLAALVALAAVWGYDLGVIQPRADSQRAQDRAYVVGEVELAVRRGASVVGGSRAVGDSNFTNLVASGDATVGGNLNVTGSASITGGYTTGSSTVYEGATANDYETTLAVTDPTADRTITLPNLSGTVLLTTNAGRVVMGQNPITGTLAVSHGLTTPEAVFCDLAADSVADAAACSATISGSTVTVKTWKADGVTAGSVGVAVNWLVAGQP